MNADFLPDMSGYNNIRPFRFWCQKVIPLVYDDSLSYYELLNKVVDYLNKTIEDVSNIETNVESLYEAYGKLQNYVNNYFSSLDIQEEINNKLDEMAEDGSLSALMEPIMSPIISQWLATHITPTSPAVDASLSVSGAAADAAVVGNKFKHSFLSVDASLNNTVDVNNIKQTGTYYTGSTMPLNWPDANPGRLVVFGWVFENINQTVQVVFIRATSKIYYRNAKGDNVWTQWYLVGNADDITDLQNRALLTYDTVITSSNNMNDVKKIGTYYCGETYGIPANWPADGLVGRCIVFSTSTEAMSETVQIVVIQSNGDMYYRIGGVNSWRPWEKIAKYSESFYVKNIVISSSDDMNTLLQTGTYYCGTTYGSPANWPVSGLAGRCMVFGIPSGAASQTVQIVVLQNSQRMFYRIGTGGTAWSNWIEVAKYNEALVTVNSVITSSDDMNNLTLPKMCYCSATYGTPTNWPVSGAVGRCIVFSTSLGVASETVQIVVLQSTQRMFYRIGTGGTAWSNWIEIANKNDVAGVSAEVSSIAMFDTVACCGDSFTAGYLYNKTDSPNYDPNYVPDGTYPKDSYGYVMGKLYGLNVTNFAQAGVTTEGFIQYVLPRLLSAEAKELYILALGLNDCTQNVPIGTVNDIDTPPATPSYIGNYGNIIKQIKQHAPNSKIILVKSLWVLTANSHNITTYYNYISGATEVLANYFGIPYMETLGDEFFTSNYYVDNLKGFHPTAPLYAGMGKRIGELVGKVIKENNNYFFNFYIPNI